MSKVGDLRIEQAGPADARLRMAETNFAIKESALLKDKRDAEYHLKHATERLKQIEEKRQALHSSFESAKLRLEKRK